MTATRAIRRSIPAPTRFATASTTTAITFPTTDDPVSQGANQIWYVDGDYDGFGDPLAAIAACDEPLGAVQDDTDCNDESADAYPGAPELCDGIDDDCDALVDEDDDDLIGIQEFWPDDDGDGLGSGAGVEQCFAPPGHADNDDDCDDGDASVGAADFYYADADGDGYGAAVLDVSCSAVTGGVSVSGDCDDLHEEVYPGAAEICDGIDDNCDGLVDDDDPTIVVAHLVRRRRRRRLRFGHGHATSCTAPSGYVAAGGDCDDADAFAYPDAYELCDAIDNDCTGTADDPVDYVDWYADTDGDGYGDALDSRNDCSQPSGYVLSSSDCDDETSSVHPECDGDLRGRRGRRLRRHRRRLSGRSRSRRPDRPGRRRDCAPRVDDRERRPRCGRDGRSRSWARPRAACSTGRCSS